MKMNNMNEDALHHIQIHEINYDLYLHLNLYNGAEKILQIFN